jgi:hypothetical protein
MDKDSDDEETVSKRRGQREGVKRIPLLGKKVKHKRDEDY